MVFGGMIEPSRSLLKMTPALSSAVNESVNVQTPLGTVFVTNAVHDQVPSMRQVIVTAGDVVEDPEHLILGPVSLGNVSDCPIGNAKTILFGTAKGDGSLRCENWLQKR